MKGTNFSKILKTLGPGILFAGAAIGGSHLIQSTRAGANYGLDLLPLVILINIFKYPFFEYGHRYTAVTGESILEGYKKLGRSVVFLFFILNIFTAIINGAAITLVTAGLTGNLFGLNYSIQSISILVLIVTLALLFIGHYKALDKIMKVMVSILAITTIITVFIALGVERTGPEIIEETDLWSSAGIAFLLALMGWMPAPIEVSVWPSLWALERTKETKYKPSLKESLIDFHIGYVGTTIMAAFFVGLGAYVMYHTGEKFSNSGIVFSSQLVSLYTKTIGEWSRVIISSIVFITMASTALTVFDAYPRTLAGCFRLIVNDKEDKSSKLYWISGITMALFSVGIIFFFTSGLKTLLDFATIVSFLAAPVFAIINYKVVTSDFFAKEYHPKAWLKLLSWAGMIFLVAFSLIYIVTRIA